MTSFWAQGSGPPPPPGQPPPLPPGPPPAYIFNATANSTHAASNRTIEFTFRNTDSSATAQRQMLVPIPRQQRADPKPRRHRNREERRTDSYRPRTRGGYPRRRVLGAHERPLMTTRREVTPEQFAGMGEGHDGKFVALDELSDSDEQEMEVDSASDKELTAGQFTDLQAKTDKPEQNVSGADEPPRKKHAKAANGVQQVSDVSLPKWSNPDPYTVLPPTEEIPRKKKDVVKLIRKARLLPKKEEPNDSIVDNDDFISFNFDDEQQQPGSESPHGHGGKEAVAGAPTGPRSSHIDRFSHREHLRQQHTQPGAPGLAGNALTSTSLPPHYPPTINASNYPLPARPIPVSRFSGGRGVSGSSSRPAISADTWPPPDTAAALGNRKRTHDDRVKGESSRRERRRPSPDGDIIPKWVPRAGSNPMPWCGEIDHSGTEDFGLRLHKEICDFYEYIRPQDFEQTVRADLVDELRNHVRERWSDSDILSFGSFATGLYLPDSDMDLVMVSDSYMQGHPAVYDRRSHLRLFHDFIDRRGISAPGTAEIVAMAKVPLVKYVDRRTGLKIDVSFENDSGVRAVQTCLSWKTTFPAMPIIVPLIKHFLAMRGLNEVFTGGLGGYSVTCLVVSLLQNMPQVADGKFIAEQHLGEVLMEFFDLYGNLLNFSTTAIRVDRPGYIEKKTLPNAPYMSQEKQNRLCIIDPHNPDNDLTGGSRNIHTIRACFSEAYGTLQRRMATLRKLNIESRKGQTLLGELFAGAYQSFDDQRQRLREVFMRRDNRSPAPGPQDANLSLGSRERGVAPQVDTRSNVGRPNLKRAAEDGGATRAKRSKTKLSSKNSTADRNRARAFKAQYPMIEGVPVGITKKQKKILLSGWREKNPKEREGEKGSRVRRSGNRVVQSNSGVEMPLAGTSWNELRARAKSTIAKPTPTKSTAARPTAAKPKAAPRMDRFPRKAHGRSVNATTGSTRSDPIEVD
ncbi:MAG: hypothetical protein M1839_007830 [Geoglossum umbratile]|nr:MAG: hypothetical protein M1839_007830 [Geoglossum umbratile]